MRNGLGVFAPDLLKIFTISNHIFHYLGDSLVDLPKFLSIRNYDDAFKLCWMFYCHNTVFNMFPNPLVLFKKFYFPIILTLQTALKTAWDLVLWNICMYDTSQVCYLEEIGTPRCHFVTYFLFELITINKTTATRNTKKTNFKKFT